MLYSKIARTEIESKSQPLQWFECRPFCCTQRSQELKLKANHNSRCCNLIFDLLYSKIARTEIESKSQLNFMCIDGLSSCTQRSQELKLKANHNGDIVYDKKDTVVLKDRKN